MARIDSTPDVIFPLLVARLINQVSGLDASSCFLSLDPDEIPGATSGDYVVVVSPSPQFRFDQSIFTGAEEYGAMATWHAAITIHSTANIDEPGRDTEFLASQALGVTAKATQVAKAILGFDPVDGNGNYVLAQPIQPSDGAIDRPTRSQGSIQFGVEITFVWDLIS